MLLVLMSQSKTSLVSLILGFGVIFACWLAHKGPAWAVALLWAAVTVVGLLGLPDQGLFARDDMRLFVTRCVGFYGYPMRVGIPPEIAVLVLRTPGAAPERTPPQPI